MKASICTHKMRKYVGAKLIKKTYTVNMVYGSAGDY